MTKMRDVMTAAPQVIDCKTPIRDAENIMINLGARHLPVTVDGIVESIVSDRDIKRFTLPAHRAQYQDDYLVKDICRALVYLADVDDPVDKVLRVMADRHIGSVLVLEEGELVGIFTENDACRLFAEFLSASG